jgi:GlpG protein
VPVSGVPAWRRALTRYPGLTALIALAVVVFLVSGFPEVAGWLTIIDLRRPDVPSLLALLAELEVWRWVTPTLLHFSILHLAFNCAVVIELGRRVERALGAGAFWLLVLALAVASNLTQYALGDSPLFGGLSGVAYGLLGFVIAMRRLVPEEPAWQLPPGIAVGLVVFLVLFSTGVTEAFGLYVANAAHWAGFLTGIALGVLRGSRRRA